MKKVIFCISALLLLTVMSSCEHRHLEEYSNAHYIRVYIDDSILNITKGLYHEDIEAPKLEYPEVLRAALCDIETGQVVNERYLQHSGKDARGYYLDGYIGAPAGVYKLIVYNFGTETTQLRNEYNCLGTEAYTNHISMQYYPNLPKLDGNSYAQYDNMNILYDPDHLWAVSEDSVVVRDHTGVDTLRTQSGDFYRAQTIVQTYYIQVKVRGAEWISSSVSLLTGVAGGKKVWYDEMITSPPAIVYFEMKQRDKTRITVPRKDKEGNDTGKMEETQTAVIYSTFNTFGKLPDVDSYFKITFSFGVMGGGNQTETLDITKLFTNDDAKYHRWIIIDHEIEIKKPEGGYGGGFTPGVDEWDEVENNIEI